MGRLGACVLAVVVAVSAAVVARPAADVRAATGTCTSVTLVTYPGTSPVTVGAAVTVATTITGCPDGPLYRWWVRYPDGVWRIRQDWSPNDFSWNTTGLAPGMYQLGVWIKDALSTNTYDTYALETFQLLDPGCTSVAVGPDIASPSGNGVTVNFTASAVGCQTPQYEWWIRDVDGNWSVVAGHDFAHSSATFTWATTGLPAGAYQIGVWARDQQSLRSYDAYGITTYQLLGNGATGSACSAVNLASEQSPQGSSIITLDAAAYGCSKAGFSFWIRDLSGNWSLIPYYSYSFGINTESYQWNSNGYSPGTYLLAVRAIELPFPPNVAYESYSIITQVILPGNECSSAGLTPSVASPQASGAVISVSATVAGPFPGYCSPAEFRFFVAAPGGPFVGTQAYSATSGFTWNTAGRAPGVYQLGVWARQQGNGSAYEAYAIVSFTLT